MSTPQPGILADVPAHALYLSFTLKPQSDPLPAIRSLAALADGEQMVVGFGLSLVSALGKSIEGLSIFPPLNGAGFDVPSTPAALWLWLRGEDRGALLHQSIAAENLLRESFELHYKIDAFQFDESRDLTGYVDGTENPEGDDAFEAGIVQGRGGALDGSSFVAVQQWIHDLNHFQSMSQEERDHTIGRRRSDNEELEDAPESAHVKRTAQEDFEPEAFILRRSMPWSDSQRAGLVFVAFGHSFDAFEAQLNRMVGNDDGIVDALFNFTRPVTGNYYWCPPVQNGRLDLTALGL